MSSYNLIICMIVSISFFNCKQTNEKVSFDDVIYPILKDFQQRENTTLVFDSSYVSIHEIVVSNCIYPSLTFDSDTFFMIEHPNYGAYYDFIEDNSGFEIYQDSILTDTFNLSSEFDSLLLMGINCGGDFDILDYLESDSLANSYLFLSIPLISKNLTNAVVYARLHTSGFEFDFFIATEFISNRWSIKRSIAHITEYDGPHIEEGTKVRYYNIYRGGWDIQ